MRTFKTIGIVLGIYIAAFAVEFIVASGSPEYRSGISFLVILGILGFLAPKIGYRWFDCLFFAIPIYGLFFIFRIAHRIAFLPQRDWSERS
jgi:hypothetical protein